MQIIAAQVRDELDLLFANCAEHLQRNPRDTTSFTRGAACRYCCSVET